MNQKHYSSKSFASIAWLTCCLVLIAGLWTSNLNAQCTNGSSFGSAVAPTGATAVTISTCSFQSEYSTITSVVAGNSYVVTGNIAGTYITMRFSTPAGQVVAAGVTPLQFTAPCSGTYYAHWNTNSACGAASSCMITTIACSSCGFVASQCTNGSAFGSATAPVVLNTPITITTCAFAQEYSTINSVVANRIYTVTGSIAGTFLTVHQGSSAGPVIASGETPLTFTSTVAGTYYLHYNTNSVCGTASSCITGTISYIGESPCACLLTVTPTSNPASICVGGTASLSATVANPTGAVSYLWNPGGLTGASVSVSPGNSTVYTVVATDQSCSASATVAVTVNPLPSVNASATPATVSCPTQSVQLNATPAPACIANYTLSSIAYAPVTGTPIAGPTGDDNVSAPISIGFNFPFYCSTKTQLVISTNGFISFDLASPNGCCSGQNIPNTGSPNDVIALCWTDLFVGTGSTDYFNLTSPNRFVIRFNGVQHCCSGPAQVDAQIILYEDGTIEIHNTAITSNGGIGTMTQGIENATGTIATPVTGRNAANWSATADAYRFTPQVSTTYAWLPAGGAGATTTVTGISATTVYTVTSTNQFGCTATATTQVTFDPVVANCSGTNTTCFGGSDGSAAVTGTGGTGPYSYLWNNATSSTTSSITGLPAGTYCVTVTDANGCTATCCYTVTEPALAFSVACSGTNVNCAGGNNGTASVVATNLNTPQSQTSIFPGSPFNSFGPLATVSTAVVPALPPLAVVTSATLNLASINAINGSWRSEFRASLAGAFTLGATQVSTLTSGGLIAPDPVINLVGFPAAGGSVDLNLSESFDDGGAGVIDATVGGASITVNYVTGQTYTYAWSNGATDAAVSGLTAGTYTVIVTNNNGCTSSCVYVVTEPSPLVAACSGTNVSCNGGSDGTAAIAASGGTNYNNGGPTVTTTSVNSFPGSPFNSFGPLTTVSTVTVPALPAGAVVNSATLTLNSINAINGSWRSEFRASLSGAYTLAATQVSVLGSGGLITPDPVINLAGFPAAGGVINLNLSESFDDGGSGVIDATVAGATIDINYTLNGYSYSWSNGNTTANPTGLTAGTYCVTVADANGCTATCCYTVTEPTALVVTCSGTNTSCNGGSDGSASVAGSGGTPTYSYLWTNGVTTSTNTGLSAGTYSVWVTDSHGCTSTSSYTVTEPTALVVSCSGSNVSCNGGSDGSASVVASGGTGSYTYSPSSSLGNLAAGTYCITVTDANGCTASCCYTVTEPAPITLNPAVQNVHCKSAKDGSITLSPTGGTPGYTYLWSGSTNTSSSRTNLAPGTYCVTVTDANGCNSSACYTITQPATPLVPNTSKTNVRCGGKNTGAATVAPTGGCTPYSFQWSNGAVTGSITNLFAGTYTCIITDACGCVKTATIVITQNPPMVVLAAPSGASTATASVSGGVSPYTYLWNTSPGQTSATATGLTPGSTYKVRVTDSKNCSQTAIVNMPLPKMNGIVSAEKFEVSVYPNPTDGIVTVNFSSFEAFNYKMMLFDLSGRMVYNSNKVKESGNNSQTFDFSYLPKGVYQLSVQSEKGNAVIKIIIQ